MSLGNPIVPINIFVIVNKKNDEEKCLEYLSFGKFISTILIGSFSTNNNLYINRE